MSEEDDSEEEGDTDMDAEEFEQQEKAKLEREKEAVMNDKTMIAEVRIIEWSCQNTYRIVPYRSTLPNKHPPHFSEVKLCTKIFLFSGVGVSNCLYINIRIGTNQ